jgi:hypothetical protein
MDVTSGTSFQSSFKIVPSFGVQSLPLGILERRMAGILASLTHELTITKYSDWLILVEKLNDAVRRAR